MAAGPLSEPQFEGVVARAVAVLEARAPEGDAEGAAALERKQAAAAGELATCINDENADVLWARAARAFDEGVAPGLVRLLSTSAVSEHRLSAVRAITMISLASSLKKPLLDTGVLPHILALFGQGDEGRYWAACACESLSFTPENILPVFEAGVVDLVTGVLREGPDEAKGPALGTLTNIADLPEAKKKVFGLGAVQAILSTLQGGDDFACAKGSGTLFTFALDPDLRAPLVAAGVVPIMLDIWCGAGTVTTGLGPAGDPGAGPSTTAAEPGPQAAAWSASPGAAGRGNDTAKANAAATLFLVCYEQESPAAVRAQAPTPGEIVSGLMRLVDHGSDPLQASKALNRMALHREAAGVIVQQVPQLLACISALDREPGVVSNDRRSILFSLLYNLSATLSAEGRDRMREFRVVELLAPCMSSRESSDFVLASLCVANLVGHVENHDLLSSDTGMVDALLSVLRASMRMEFYGGFLWELWAPLQGLANLSVNDHNKQLIYDSGALDPITEVLRATPSPANARAQEYAARTVSNLAFTVDVTRNRRGLEGVLKRMSPQAGHSTPAAQFAMLALFQIAQRRVGAGAARSLGPGSAAAASSEGCCGGDHLLLAFPPKYEALFLRLRDYLQGEGFQVHAEQSRQIEVMVDAIDHSSAVLFCLASEFKESEECRTQWEYASRIGKPCLSIAAQPSYTPDGWLRHAAEAVAFEFARPGDFEPSCCKLVDALKRFGVAPSAAAAGQSPPAEQCGTSRADAVGDLTARLAQAEDEIQTLREQMGRMYTAEDCCRLEQRVKELEAVAERLSSNRIASFCPLM